MEELQVGRRTGVNGPEPITWGDVTEWGIATDRRVQPHEVRALVLLDRVSLYPSTGEEDNQDG